MDIMSKAIEGPNSAANQAFQIARQARAISTSGSQAPQQPKKVASERVDTAKPGFQGAVSQPRATEPVSTGKEAPALHTNTPNSPRSLWPVVAGVGLVAAAAVGITALLTHGDPASADATPGTPEQEQGQGNYAFVCNAPGGKQSFARQAPAGSHQFGPNYDTANIKIGEVIDRLQMKMPCDVSFMAAMEQFRVAKGEFDPKAAEELARKMRDDEEYWKSVHENFNKLLVGYDLRNNPDVRYASLGMIIDPNAPSDVLPTFTQFGDHPVLGWTLVLKFDNNGDGEVDEELSLRVICDLQPAITEFKFVPTPPTNIPPVNPPMTTVYTPPPSTTPPPVNPPPPCEETGTCPPPPCEETGTCPPPPCEETGTCPPPPCEVTGECKTDVHVPLPQAPPAQVTKPPAPPRVPQIPWNGEPEGSANNEDRHSPGGVTAVDDGQQPVHDAEPDVNTGAQPEPQAPAPNQAPTTNQDPD